MRDVQNAALARNWWAVALRGVAGIIFGLIAILAPAAAMVSLALLFGAYLLIDGVFALVAAARAAGHHERWGMLLAEGVLNLIMGGIVFVFPAGAILAFVFVTAAWALITGGLMLASASNLHVSHGRWWLALGGIVSLIWGVLLVVAPLAGALVLTWWLGVYAILFGISMLVLGFQLRGRHRGAYGAPGLRA